MVRLGGAIGIYRATLIDLRHSAWRQSPLR